MSYAAFVFEENKFALNESSLDKEVAAASALHKNRYASLIASGRVRNNIFVFFFPKVSFIYLMHSPLLIKDSSRKECLSLLLSSEIWPMISSLELISNLKCNCMNIIR